MDGVITVDREVRQILGPENSFLLHARTGRCYTLNAFGTRIWQRLATGQTPDDIHREIVATCTACSDVVNQDLDSFLYDLIAKHLVKHTIEERAGSVAALVS